MSNILLDKLETTLADKLIFVQTANFKKRDAMTIKDNDTYDILIQSKEKTMIEIMSIIRHEVAHIELDEFYGTFTSNVKRGKIEHRVKRKIALNTIPSDALKTMLTNQVSIYEIADFFNVTENDVKDAIEVYMVREWVI